MTISKKIVLGFALPLFILTVIGAVTYRTTSSLIWSSSLVAHTHEVIEATGAVLQRVVDAETGVRGLMATGQDKFLEPYRGAQLDCERLLTRLHSLLQDSVEQQRRVSELDEVVRERFEQFKVLIAKRQAGSEISAEALGEGKASMDNLRHLVAGLTDTEHLLLQQRDLEAQESARFATATIVFGSIIGILLAVVSSVLITRSINRSIGTLAVGAEKVGGGELDYRIPVDSRDEVGLVAEAFNRMTERRQQMEAQLQQKNADSLKVLSAVTESCDRLAVAATELLSSTAHQSSGAQEQSAAVTETVAIVEEVAQTSSQASDRARLVAESAQQSSEVSSAGRATVEEVVSTMGLVSDQSAATAEIILALAERTQAIGEIISSVNDLAEQTNLLALNAAIEAARAGEHGRGFGVVASEIKALADQSKKSTVQVRQILGEIQKSANRAVLATEESTKAMSGAVRKASTAGEAIRKLTDVIELSAQRASQIAASAGQQATGLQQINHAMKDINKATSQTLASTRQVEQAARDLSSIGVSLKELLSG